MRLHQTEAFRLVLYSGLGLLPACGGDERPPTPCLNPSAGWSADVEKCADGRTHRPGGRSCNSSIPRAEVQGGVEGDACEVDTDCTERERGYCERLPTPHPVFPSYAQCYYGCTVDAECGSGSACRCGDPIGVCESRPGCITDADCDAGFLCSAYEPGLGMGCGFAVSYACETPEDECRTDEECRSRMEGSRVYCVVKEGERHRSCAQGSTLTCGRPFLVAGWERLAPVALRQDWSAQLIGAPLRPLPHDQRQVLGAAWTKIGLMEHASVAAFARFTLQLLQVGAPATLVEQSQRAQTDEAAHAKLCFSLASQYLDRPVGPGALEMHGALQTQSLTEIVRLTIAEGCIGESLAALEAVEALNHAQEHRVRAVLARIAEDERQHAQLAWAFLKWALEQGDAALRAAVHHEFAAHAATLVDGSATTPEDKEPGNGTAFERRKAPAGFNTLPHGILPPALSAKLRIQVLQQVVLPCAKELLEACNRSQDRNRHQPQLPQEASHSA